MLQQVRTLPPWHMAKNDGPLTMPASHVVHHVRHNPFHTVPVMLQPA